ncbi:MAG: creatininase family protein [Solirubrobacteraceae bacterium]
MVRCVELETLAATALAGLIDDGVTTAVVPFGSVEHHGGHLPLGADALIADAIGREVAGRLGGVLVPTVRVGDSGARVSLPGTMSVSAATLTAVAFDLSLSLASAGFRFIALVSTHGGNRAALDEAVRRVSVDRCVVFAPLGDLGSAPGSYSGEWLTSVMLAVRPDLVDLGAVSEELKSEVAAASDGRGHEHFERFVESCVRAVLAVSGGGRQASL